MNIKICVFISKNKNKTRIDNKGKHGAIAYLNKAQ